MRTKQKWIVLISLFTLLLSIATRCEKDADAEKPEIAPCEGPFLSIGGDVAKVMEIKNLQTKLYFLSSYSNTIDENLFLSIIPEGIIYSQLYNAASFIYIRPDGLTMFGGICNFPDYPVNWNRKNQNMEIVPGYTVEDTINVIVSAKVHLTDVSTIGYFELTSIKKQIAVE
jgi:hypothetical protein